MDVTKVTFISQLSDTNYSDWSLRIKALCSVQGCAAALTRHVGATEGDLCAVTPEQSTKALSMIFLNVNERWLRKISTATQAHEAWTLLKEFHIAALKPMLSSLHDKVFTSHMTAGQSVDDYIDLMEKLQSDLTSFQQALPDDTLMSQILRTLTPSLRNAAFHLATDVSSLNMMKLRASLRALESMQGTPQRALRAQGEWRAPGPRTDKDGGSRQEVRGNCHHCNQPGHRKFDCYLWRAANPPANSPASSSSHSPAAPRPAHAMQARVSGGAPIAPTQGYHGAYPPNNARISGWVVDSGATEHMTGDPTQFEKDSLLQLKTLTSVTFGDGSCGWAEAYGTVALLGCHGTVRLMRVLYVPSLQGNLLSLPAATSRGIQAIFEGPHVYFQSQSGDRILTASLCDGLFVTNTTVHCCTAVKAAASPESEACRWHERLGHTSYGVLAHMQRKGALPGCALSPETFLQARDSPCEPCLAGRLTRSPHPASLSPVPRRLHRLHADLQGPFRVPASCGALYVLCVVDALTGYGETALLRLKSDAPSATRRIILLLETQAGVPVQRLRTDRGGEFVKLAEFFAEKGIVHELTAPYSSVQNGIAERYNRTLMDRARSLLAAAGLPASYWGEAVTHANAILNVVHRTTADVSPMEAMTGVKPDLRHLHVFGSIAWVHTPNPSPGKLGSRGVKGIYLGDSGSLGSGTHKILADGRMFLTCDVHFTDLVAHAQLDNARLEFLATPEGLPDEMGPVDESTDPLGEAVGHTHAKDPSYFLPALSGGSDLPAQVIDSVPASDVEYPGDSDESSGVPAASADGSAHLPWDVVHIPCPLPGALPVPVSATQHAGKVTRSMARSGAYALTAHRNDVVPTSVAEALSVPDSIHWQAAIDEELAAMSVNNCWSMKSLPAGAHAIGSRFVFARKRDGRYKARLVAKGFSQKPGIDFDQTYAPVSSIATVRCFAATVALQDLEWTQIDFASAFLNGTLDRTIYMRPPAGCDFGSPGLVCALERSIYGLKQAGYHWDGAIRGELLSAGFQPCDADTCLYFLTTSCGGKVWILLYVDDGLIAATSRALLEHWTAVIMRMFSARRMGDPIDFLGLSLIRDRAAGTVRITQLSYIERLSKEYGAENVRVPLIPLAGQLPLSGELASTDQLVAYPSIVGSLNYIACCTRPDISQSISALSRHLKAPLAAHYAAALRVLAYLVGTSGLGLVYRISGSRIPFGYTDADYAGDPVKRRSTTGTVYLLGSAAVIWTSKLQTTVALSTTEAEYQAAGAASREALWLRKIMPALGNDLMGPIQILCDSESALALLKNPMTTQRSKHIDVVHHFSRERVLSGEIAFSYVGTDKNVADCLTKTVPENKLVFCRDNFGLCV